MKLNRQSITEFRPRGKSSRMIWVCYKEGICQTANGKKQITDVILAPGALEYNRKLKIKKFCHCCTNQIRFSFSNIIVIIFSLQQLPVLSTMQ